MENLLPHSGLKSLAENLWILEGSLPHDVPLPRSMVIFRNQNKDLWVHSPVAVDELTKKRIDQLGNVKWIVVPNEMHRLDAPEWKKSYPRAKVVCPRADRAKVSEKVPVGGVAEEEFSEGPIRALPMPGAKRNELAYELDLGGKSALVVNDLLVNVPGLPGILGKLLKLTGRIGRFRVPFPQKILFLTDRRLFRNWLETMAKKNFTILTVSHGSPVTKDVSLRLQEAAEKI